MQSTSKLGGENRSQSLWLQTPGAAAKEDPPGVREPLKFVPILLLPYEKKEKNQIKLRIGHLPPFPASGMPPGARGQGELRQLNIRGAAAHPLSTLQVLQE